MKKWICKLKKLLEKVLASYETQANRIQRNNEFKIGEFWMFNFMWLNIHNLKCHKV
jgi:hypothetical protein